ncbi:MAG: cysteine desulfurase [Gemmatimonadetes bacterium]|nr:cysteine desulfurase [Gemmatimonadota bacterium]
MKRVYLDYAATAPLRREVWEAMEAELGHCYNPASAHTPGRQAHRCLEQSRGLMADLLCCGRSEISFTGGGTQSDNLAILGFVRAHPGRPVRVLVSAIEHQACLASANRAGVEGASVMSIPADGTGTVDLDWLERALATSTRADGGAAVPTLISVMWANNEIGVVQPIDAIVELAERYGALVHTDAVQAWGKVEVDLTQTPVDLLSASSHKLGGPVGIGLLYCRRGVELEPLSYGGGQERSMWPGTQNPLGAVGFARAAALAVEERPANETRWNGLRRRLEDRVLARIDGARIHGHGAPARLPHIASVGIPGCDPGALLVSLDLDGVAASGGSACSSGGHAGSSVLEAIGAHNHDPYATVRFSFGHCTEEHDVDRAADSLIGAARRFARLTV